MLTKDAGDNVWNRKTTLFSQTFLSPPSPPPLSVSFALYLSLACARALSLSLSLCFLLSRWESKPAFGLPLASGGRGWDGRDDKGRRRQCMYFASFCAPPPHPPVSPSSPSLNTRTLMPFAIHAKTGNPLHKRFHIYTYARNHPIRTPARSRTHAHTYTLTAQCGERDDPGHAWSCVGKSRSRPEPTGPCPRPLHQEGFRSPGQSQEVCALCVFVRSVVYVCVRVRAG